MKVYGLDSVRSLLDDEHYLFKLVANEQAVFLFPHTTQHQDAKQPGLNYQDDYAGNALAAMVERGQIAFRFHRDFSSERVKNLAQSMFDHPDLGFAKDFTIRYQQQVLIAGDSEA